jgi:two-component system, OmpR family, sensor histidine kinase BaeS
MNMFRDKTGAERSTNGQMRWRRLPLALALFGILFVQVLVAIGLMTGLGTLNLRQGFKDYQIARDTEMLEGFAIIAAQRIEAAGSLDAFTSIDGSMRSVLDELRIQRGIKTPSPPEGAPPPPRGALQSKDRTPPPPPRRGRPDSFGARVAIFSLEGRQIDGFQMPNGAKTIGRDIILAGKPIAIAKVQLVDVPDGVEARFLKGQTNALLLVSLVLIIVSALASWWVAQIWARPLNAMRAATSRIAEGEFSVRVPVAGLREVAATTENINNMANALERLERARRVWLAEISHELRTPVTIMRGELESLMDGVRAPSSGAVLSLHEEVLVLTRLIDDLHLIALGDTGRLPCTFEAVALGPVVDSACRRFRPQADAKGLELTFAPSGLSDFQISTDEHRLAQVLAIILSNSVRYTAAPGSIHVTTARVLDYIEIRVEDSAPGVDDEALEVMFESFRRLDPSRNKESGGSGLGLAVARTLVGALGGTIAASHAKSGGICVTITLPASSQKS